MGLFRVHQRERGKQLTCWGRREAALYTFKNVLKDFI